MNKETHITLKTISLVYPEIKQERKVKEKSFYKQKQKEINQERKKLIRTQNTLDP